MKTEILIATGNPGKTEEFRKILGDENFNFLTLKDIDFHDEIIEDGDSFEANAKIKAIALQDHYSGYILADDSGLEVEALGGAPGIYTARYAGIGATDQENYQKLLDDLKGETNRKACFVCVLALLSPDRELNLFRGEVPGWIQESPRGEQGFGYDPVFAPERESELQAQTSQKTFAEMSHVEKKSDSHRGRAIQQLASSALLPLG